MWTEKEIICFSDFGIDVDKKICLRVMNILFQLTFPHLKFEEKTWIFRNLPCSNFEPIAKYSGKTSNDAKDEKNCGKFWVSNSCNSFNWDHTDFKQQPMYFRRNSNKLSLLTFSPKLTALWDFHLCKIWFWCSFVRCTYFCFVNFLTWLRSFSIFPESVMSDWLAPMQLQRNH